LKNRRAELHQIKAALTSVGEELHTSAVLAFAVEVGEVLLT